MISDTQIAFEQEIAQHEDHDTKEASPLDYEIDEYQKRAEDILCLESNRKLLESHEKKFHRAHSEADLVFRHLIVWDIGLFEIMRQVILPLDFFLKSYSLPFSFYCLIHFREIFIK